MSEVTWKNGCSNAVLFVLSVNPALSLAEESDTGFYIGAGVGHSELEDACNDITGSCDETDRGAKLFGGYRFNSFFSLEGGYVELGESDVSGEPPCAIDPPLTPVAGPAVQDTPTPSSVEAYGFFVAGVASWPISSSFSVFSKIGLLYWDVETDIRRGSLSTSEDDVGQTFCSVLEPNMISPKKWVFEPNGSDITTSATAILEPPILIFYRVV